MHLVEDGGKDPVVGLGRDHRHPAAVAQAVQQPLRLVLVQPLRFQRHDMGADLGQQRALHVADPLGAQLGVAPAVLEGDDPPARGDEQPGDQRLLRMGAEIVVQKRHGSRSSCRALAGARRFPVTRTR